MDVFNLLMIEMIYHPIRFFVGVVVVAIIYFTILHLIERRWKRQDEQDANDDSNNPFDAGDEPISTGAVGITNNTIVTDVADVPDLGGQQATS